MAVTASTSTTTVIVKEDGAKGDPGTNGTNGAGFNQVRKSLIDNPLCHLFKTNKLVEASAPTGTDSDVTHTRSTTATYVDRYGVVKTAAIDTIREEKDGFLIEGASTNLILWSEDFSNAAWTNLNVTVSTDTITAPDSNVTADRVTSTGDGLIRQVYGAATVSNTYTFSVWLKSTSTLNTNINIDDVVNPITSVPITITTEWQRFSVTHVAGDASLFCSVGGFSTFPNASIIDVWGAQLEQLPFASSYIPTTTATVTRTADSVSVPYLNNHGDLLGKGDFSYFIKCNLLGVDAVAFPVIVSVDNYQYSLLRINSSADLAYFRDGSGVSSTISDVTAVFSAAVTVSADNTVLYLDGANVASGSQVPVTESLPTKITIGDGTGNILYGHVKDFRSYDFVLNQDEVTYLSGA